MIENENKTIGLVKVCKALKEKFPNRDIDFYKILIAVDVLRQFVDNEWVNQTIFKQHNDLEKKNKDAFSFFKSNDNGYIWQTRTYFLSEWVYNLREIKNFNLIIKEIINGHLVSRYAEIEIGAHLLLRGINFEFIEPIGIKTRDYDLKIVDEITVNCEIKHKLESTKLTTNTIKNTISNANKQLPKNEFGIIFLKIPQDWSKDKKILETLNQIVLPFFKRNDSHILGIVLRWELQDPLLNNIIYFMFKVIRNDYFKKNEFTDKLLNKLESNFKNENWVSFEEVINKHMINK